MSSDPERDPQAEDPQDAEVVGVPPDADPQVKPSATGVVTGPLDEEPEVDIADVRSE